MKSRALITAGIIALGIGLGTYTLVKPPSARSTASGQHVAPPSLISVQVGALKRMTLHRYVTGYGVVVPAPETAHRPAAASAIAAPVTGVVTKVAVAAGEHVRRGQVLVELNSARMTEAYAAQEAARQERLYAQHNTSLKALQNAEAHLALLRVTAPLSGTVASVNVKPGAAVDTSTVLAEVIDLARLVVRADIPEGEASELAPEEQAEVPGATPIPARLAYVSPTVDADDGAVMTWASLPPHSGLRPGQYVRLRIVTATHRDTLAAPSASVVTRLGGRSVMSVVRGNEAFRIPVKVGLREHGWVEVAGPGLQAGTRIVTVGAYGLPARTAIRIVNTTGPTSPHSSPAP